MGIMYFDSNPIPEVEAFVNEHYDGGTVLDFGCGCGRYAHLFPDDKYMGVDGHEGNIKAARKRYPKKKFIHHDLEVATPEFTHFDYLFSSVVFDQMQEMPIGWADKYILVENKMYKDKFNVEVDEGLKGSKETRMMLCTKLSNNSRKK
jgi:SAM-dependent methyltransferase